LAGFDFYTARWPDFIVYLRTRSSLRLMMMIDDGIGLSKLDLCPTLLKTQ